MLTQRQRLFFCIDGLSREPIGNLSDGVAQAMHSILVQTRDMSSENVDHDRTIGVDLWCAAESFLRARNALVETMREVREVREREAAAALIVGS